MAPEQAKAQPVDQRADIYAFGLILYDLLLGRTARQVDRERLIAELTRRMKTGAAVGAFARSDNSRGRSTR